jgi:hypothetical protein
VSSVATEMSTSFPLDKAMTIVCDEEFYLQIGCVVHPTEFTNTPSGIPRADPINKPMYSDACSKTVMIEPAGRAVQPATPINARQPFAVANE